MRAVEMARTHTEPSEIAKRAWFAWHALPRDERGRPPPRQALEQEFGMSQATFSRLYSGQVQTPDTLTLGKMARALRCDFTWLVNGTGEAPQPASPSYEIPPMPGAKKAPQVPERIVELDDRYDARKDAARIAREGGVSEQAIQDVLGDSLFSAEDRPAYWWIKQFELREIDLKRREPPGTPVDEHPNPPGPRARRSTKK